MIDDDELERLLRRGKETRHLEFKRPGSLGEAEYRANVWRAMMGMANLRGGGTVILGAEDTNTWNSPGITDDVAYANWGSHDLVAAKIAPYVDPHIEFSTECRQITDGRRFVVIEVSEFDDVPVLCAKTIDSAEKKAEPRIKKGALYVRTREGTIATVEAGTSGQMRDVVTLATRKSLQQYLATAGDAGGAVVLASDVAQLARSSDVAAYTSELVDLYVVAADIGEPPLLLTGYLEARIFPETRDEHRFKRDELTAIVTGAAVRVRGWDAPHVETRLESTDTTHKIMGSYVSGSTDYDKYVEYWRMFCDGQFVHLRALPEERLDDERLSNWLGDVERPLAFTTVLYNLMEHLELAARLSQNWLDSRTVVSIEFHGLEGRSLAFDEVWDRVFAKKADENVWRMTWTLDAAELAAGVQPLAMVATRDLLTLFGLSAEDHQMQRYLDDLPFINNLR